MTFPFPLSAKERALSRAVRAEVQAVLKRQGTAMEAAEAAAALVRRKHGIPEGEPLTEWLTERQFSIFKTATQHALSRHGKES